MQSYLDPSFCLKIDELKLSEIGDVRKSVDGHDRREEAALPPVSFSSIGNASLIRMTSLDEIERRRIEAAGVATTTGHRLTLELTETLKLAVPIVLTQLGQIAMMTTDLALIGRLGDEAVAAAALASTVFFVSFTFGMGLVSAVAPLAAQAFGGRNPRMVRRALRVGLWAAF